MPERDDRKPAGTRRIRGSVGCALVLLFSGSALAQDRSATMHVRGEAGMQRLIDDAARRAPAIRAWMDRLQALDVIVYVRARAFTQTDLEGRVTLLSKAGTYRYLVIELACGRPEIAQMATLGHELFHAIEIAEEPSVLSPDTLAAFYSRIGIKTGDANGSRTFETEAAAAAGVFARRQLLTSTRNGNGT